MNQESSDRDEMRPEYDFRGGVRGKYFDRYRQTSDIKVTVTFHAEGSFIAGSSSAARQDDIAPSRATAEAITRLPSYPPPYPSPKIQVPDDSRAMVHAGQNPPR